jgi:hypothetical protein
MASSSAGARSIASTSTSRQHPMLPFCACRRSRRSCRIESGDYSDCFDKESLLIKLAKARCPDVVDDLDPLSTTGNEGDDAAAAAAAANTCRPQKMKQQEKETTSACPNLHPRLQNPAHSHARRPFTTIRQGTPELTSVAARRVGLLEKKDWSKPCMMPCNKRRSLVQRVG